jgi:hypothetical protein
MQGLPCTCSHFDVREFRFFAGERTFRPDVRQIEDSPETAFKEITGDVFERDFWLGIVFVCHCDHGQCYCSESCRAVVRGQQRREANRRYQRTEPGRLNHSHWQRTYRQRHGRFCVTDQGPRSITTPGVIGQSARPRCSVCGRQCDWIDPFGPLPPLHRARSPRRPFGHGSKRHVFA